MDNKIMVDVANKPGREVPVTKETSTPAVPGDYHEYSGSQNKAYTNAYDGQMAKLSDALGNKDSAKG